MKRWAATYHIGLDGYVAQEIFGDHPLPKWLVPISDDAAKKLREIGHLPCKALLGSDERDDRARLEERILAYKA